MKHLAISLICIMLAMPSITKAQKLVDKREQAVGWYVPVKFIVTAQGAKAKTVDVHVYKDNKEVLAMPNSKSKFSLGLDLDNDYTIVLKKEGYRAKSIYINTSIPEELVRYPGYECTMDLEPASDYAYSDPFYMDFPSAIVRWDPEVQGFYPQAGYLRDIQSKMAMLQVQMDPHQ